MIGLVLLLVRFDLFRIWGWRIKRGCVIGQEILVFRGFCCVKILESGCFVYRMKGVFVFGFIEQVVCLVIRQSWVWWFVIISKCFQVSRFYCVFGFYFNRRKGISDGNNFKSLLIISILLQLFFREDTLFSWVVMQRVVEILGE